MDIFSLTDCGETSFVFCPSISILPDPLANTSSEFLIENSSAVSYDVKKGDLVTARIGHGTLELTVEKVKHERKSSKK